VARIVARALPHPDEAGSVRFFRREERPHAPAAPGLAPGKRVGDFRLVGMIGEGGMGQVWEAEQVTLKRRVAVKFVRPERVTERQLELFAREARAGGRLSHPGIVTIHGHGQSDGLAWIAMEFVDGAWTLRDFLDDVSRSGEVPEGYDREVARLVAEIADAMQAAHDANVIHRDLKPQNVLITSDDRPKVTDFGLARITDEAALSVTGEFSGTYYYMSPEQVAAKRAGIDNRTDVFSLGTVLYECLALRRPFEGDTTQQVAAQILAKDPPDIRTIRSRAPRDLAVIAAKALEKDPDKRFQTMKELAADLRRWLGHEPILSRPPTRIERIAKWVRRNPARSVAGGITAVAFVLVSGLSMALWSKSTESEQRRLAAETSAEREREAANLARTNEKRAAAGEREARQEKERADREASAAIAARDDVLRLSALQRLDDLTTEADRLWPAHPENIPELEAWLARAEALVGELPDHEAKLAELRTRARPRTATQNEGESAARAEWTFDDDQDRWWHNQLERLVDGIRALADEQTGLLWEGISPQHGWGVGKRLANAVALRDAFAAGGDSARAWTAALPEIRAAYPGLTLTPQLALVPLGPDPDSGLWEFAHLETGDPPLRGADGRLVLGGETGLVFVLLPGGTFSMGAQSTDPDGPNFDPRADDIEGPVHEVTLSPFFLSKYEMTQGQWARFAGQNPSGYPPGESFGGKPITLLDPVEQVSWVDGTILLSRLGLALPSEAQWEYGARAGTTTVWWTGNERDSLEGAANLPDRAAARAGAPWPSVRDWPELDDGWAIHAPVGSFAPNPFGLHDVHGNCWEWCQDGYEGHFYGRPAGKDPLSSPESSADRVLRGGAFIDTAAQARSAYRSHNSPLLVTDNLGLRPARNIEP